MAPACEFGDNGIKRLLIEGESVTALLTTHNVHQLPAGKLACVKSCTFLLIHFFVSPAICSSRFSCQAVAGYTTSLPGRSLLLVVKIAGYYYKNEYQCAIGAFLRKI